MPAILYRRLDELGIDVSILYPSLGLIVAGVPDAEMRRAGCRALNRYAADLLQGLGDRLLAPAILPVHTPAEAIAELEYCVEILGSRSCVIMGNARRVRPEFRDDPSVPYPRNTRIDALGLDTEYDYDPFWRRCVELGVAPASHTPGMGWGSRRSRLELHGEPHRLLRRERRSGLSLDLHGRRHAPLPGARLRPARGRRRLGLHPLRGHPLALAEAQSPDDRPPRSQAPRQRAAPALFDEYQDAHFHPKVPGLVESLAKLEPEPPFDRRVGPVRDRARGGHRRRIFVPRFYFGCEADDPTVAWAFSAKSNPHGAKLRAMFSSDMGHWDVPDMEGILCEAFELVEHGHLDEGDFREFVCTNPLRFYTRMNPLLRRARGSRPTRRSSAGTIAAVRSIAWASSDQALPGTATRAKLDAAGPLDRLLGLEVQGRQDEERAAVVAAEGTGDRKLLGRDPLEDLAALAHTEELAAEGRREPDRVLRVEADAVRHRTPELRPDSALRERSVGRDVEGREPRREGLGDDERAAVGRNHQLPSAR